MKDSGEIQKDGVLLRKIHGDKYRQPGLLGIKKWEVVSHTQVVARTQKPKHDTMSSSSEGMPRVENPVGQAKDMRNEHWGIQEGLDREG